MTVHPLTLERVTCRLPDGRTLFSDVSFTFEPHATGLVGANGVGKSLLARVLAGALAPTAGRVVGGGRVFLLPALSGVPQGRVADLAGVGDVLDALDRIAAGSVAPDDFSCVDDRWDLRAQLQGLWQRAGLPADLRPEDPASRLSGGQAMQVALSGAWASGADWLILDEPSNHLDATRRARLRDALAAWRGGLLVISHDRQLLGPMQSIVELDATGLQRYSGGFAAYLDARQAQQAAAQAQLEHARQQHRQQQKQVRDQHQRAQQRASRGQRNAREANQAPILLGLQKQRAQASAGRLSQLHAQRLADTAAQLRQASAGVQVSAELVALAPDAGPATQRVAALDGVVLPWGCAAPLQLVVQRGQRWAVEGDNGNGKSTLLRVLAGQLAAAQGSVEVAVPVALLDQALSPLPDHAGVLAALQAANPAADPATLRTRLALLGLDAKRIERPCVGLSAGERVKAAMACTLYADPAPGLLLLDEPGNALDLDALQALEALLDAYPGTLMMASHDPQLLQAMRPTHRLQMNEHGWEVLTA